jgi:acylphosphatase
MTEPSLRIHIWVIGRVQGVGFRAFVAFCAEEIGVNGWVRNVSWNTVETLAEGNREQIDQFIHAVKTGPSSSRVDDCRIDEETYTGEFPSFEIRSSR